MRGGEVNGRTWHELARVPAPVEPRCLWRVILEKTEHPERYNPALRSAEVIDQDATVVIRRTQPADGPAYLEWVTHACRAVRVEYRRHGQHWLRAQALVETDDGPCLVYEVDDPDAARRAGGIDPAYARGVLAQLVASARARRGVPVTP